RRSGAGRGATRSVVSSVGGSVMSRDRVDLQIGQFRAPSFGTCIAHLGQIHIAETRVLARPVSELSAADRRTGAQTPPGCNGGRRRRGGRSSTVLQDKTTTRTRSPRRAGPR